MSSPETSWGKAAEHGLTSFDVPEAYGGGGVESLRTICLIQEELSWGDAPIGTLITSAGFVVGLLLAMGTAEQRRKWVPPLWTSNPRLTVLAITEPHAGSDAASSTTGTHYTVETHLSFLQEVRPDDRLHVDTKVLGFDERRLHAFHTRNRSHDRVTLAAAEQMFVHVDARERRVAPVVPEVLTRIERIAMARADLPRPERAGRWIAFSAAAT